MKETVEKLINKEHTPHVKEGWPVSFKEISPANKVNIPIKLPGIKPTLRIISENTTELQGTIFEKVSYTLWNGIIDGPLTKGNFFLLKGDNGAIGGFLQYDGHTFELLGDNKEIGVLRRPDFSYNAETSCAVPNESNREGFTNSNFNNFNSTGICDSPPSSCSNTWQIANAYPQADLDAILATYNGNTILAGLYLAIVKATFTVTLSNSGIGAPNLTIHDVNIGNYTPTSSDIGVAIEDFNNHANSTIALLIYDKVVLCTYYSFGTANGTVNCIPFEANGGFQPDCNAAIVNLASTWYPRLTYAHEVGHLFGARHESDPEELCGHGKQFAFTGGEDRTVMTTIIASNSTSTSSRILRFSEFLEYYNGYHIGGSNQRNKRLVQNFICENYSLYQNSPSSTSRLKNNPKGEKIKTFPNPVRDKLVLEFLNQKIQKIDLNRIDGRHIRTIDYKKNDAILEMDVSNLVKGTYFLKFKTFEDYKTVRFIKL